MFNGIVKNTGLIKKINRNKRSMIISVLSNLKVNKTAIGSSIACNAVCLTLISKINRLLKFYLSQETINRSNFSKIKKGNIINLEKYVKFGDEISGHYTQGHVDTVGKILNI